MKLPHSIIAILIAISAPLHLFASVTDPNLHLAEYNRIVAETGENDKSYDYVMGIYNEYAPVLNSPTALILTGRSPPRALNGSSPT